MPSTPTVSVVIPNYNYARTLGLCLESLTRQTLPVAEVIVVDDGSTDGSAALAEAAGAKVLHTGGNFGPPAARNVGAAAASGEILLFLDSDVALEPDAVQTAVAMLEADPGIGAVCGSFLPVPLIADGLVEEYRCLQLAYWMRDEGVISTSYTAILAIRAQLYADVGGMNADLRHTENADFGHRLSRDHRVILTQRVKGRHDHDDRLKVLLGKFFTRARLHVPLYLRRPEFDGGLASDGRGWGALSAAAALATLPLALLGAAWLVLPALLVAVSIACDLGMYRFVARERGPVFVVYYAALHYLVNVTVTVAMAIGLAQWLVSPGFRSIYQTASSAPENARPEAAL